MSVSSSSSLSIAKASNRLFNPVVACGNYDELSTISSRGASLEICRMFSRTETKWACSSFACYKAGAVCANQALYALRIAMA